MNIVILAAGQGKRMNSALPKVLHPLAGKPLLKHVIDTARGLHPRRIVVVYGHGGEAVPQALSGAGTNQADLAYVKQEPQLGTGHAVMQALPALEGHASPADLTLVLYGDVPLTRAESLQALVAAAQEAKGLAILTVELDDPAGYGRIVRENAREAGKITRIVEHKDASEAERAIREVNTGIMAIPAARLEEWLKRLSNKNAQGEYYLTDIVAMAVADGVAVTSAQPAAAWETLGVNSKLQLAELERVAQRNTATALLEQGVTLADPARIDVRGMLSCGRDVSIDVNCVFEGEVVLGNDIVIGPNCVLKNVRVRAGTVINAYTHIEEAEIGANCRIGPYARLRPGAKLDEDVHIGNFVEVKNANVGKGSKANHLAYVGDSDVGRGVNIGAGTITCNYDGVNKHRTVIEDGVFVGSDSTLVAPVTLRAGSYIGAGSTITRETPAGKLTLTRAKQMTVDAWKPPVKKPKA
ncbi:MAG TPA: bifunctional UDP-N-acetylglucosamine diphosphorylase/glucosamine-1-phosphate N-acetyltransferase GlmU [Burkholderiales bacterium]